MVLKNPFKNGLIDYKIEKQIPVHISDALRPAITVLLLLGQTISRR
jgi:hypothetical protein